ncbi:succinate dehydrogenase iron-sulfur subunit [Numidum massiliense]|uniref:succinate dehydrogenase iron-sulfur subunit n=1 Tax=Numidum massiliense TaxID=1522315 RepID=UPI0006D59C6E|nr:succinate dehydrogenase iron-sulfur subunit [Numidum massiliense]
MADNKQTIELIVTRQQNETAQPYEERFVIPYRPSMNVVSALMAIRKHPVNAAGEVTSPVEWEAVCLEEVCGACSMRINGEPRQACSALVDQLEQPIRLAPLSKFPVIRDLKVDRSRMFDALKQVKAWIPIDGTHDLGAGPRFPERKRQWAYELSKCMTCGLCLESCPNYNDKSPFIGPAPLSQVRLFNAHPTGAMHKEERLQTIMGQDGITGCGNAQNCVRVCPKEISLTTSLADLNRQTVRQSFKNFFGSFY